MEKRDPIGGEPKRLIVAWAFEYGEDGELRPAFDPQEMRSEHQAIMQAQSYMSKYVGAIAWARDAQPDIGEYGDPIMLFRWGAVPDLE